MFGQMTAMQQTSMQKIQPGIGSSFRRPRRCLAVSVHASTWTKVSTVSDLKQANGKLVVEVNGQRILLAMDGDNVRAVSNKCSHLGLPLVGKTAMFQADISNGCVTCPAHGTAFNLESGQVVGDWCPKMPSLPLIGKIGGDKPVPLPTFESRTDDSGSIEVLV